MLNEHIAEKIKTLKEQLDNNSASNPTIFDQVVGLDEFSLAETHIDVYNPVIEKNNVYTRIDGRLLYGTVTVYHDGTGTYRARTPCAETGRMKIKFWGLGCKHELRNMTGTEVRNYNITLMRCEHAVICAHCKYVSIYDSGD